MCEAPLECTYTLIRGFFRTKDPVAPAWSRWMCVNKIAFRSAISTPRAASSDSRVGSVDAGPGSTKNFCSPASIKVAAIDCGCPSQFSSIGLMVCTAEKCNAAGQAPRSGCQHGSGPNRRGDRNHLQNDELMDYAFAASNCFPRALAPSLRQVRASAHGM